MPEEAILKQIEEMQKPPKRGPGRPKGSKNKPGSKKHEFPNESIIARMGDERVTAFVQYHMDMMKMRQGVDKKNVPDLYNRFFNYLGYCAEHGVIPNNMNAYFAIGINKNDIGAWYAGRGTPEQRQFAEDIKQFFASIHEQAGGENIVNPILSIYWSKSHDGMSDNPRIEVTVNDPLGEKASSAEIADRYRDLLPSDN